MKAWLGLGSNLQHPVSQLKQALNRLASLSGVEVLRVSSFYRTPPWGDEQQDEFINAVAEIETCLDPEPLLRALQSIENAMGRQRGERRWGPRLIDIDLLLFGDQQFQSEDLVVPHPHMTERAFVLKPLCELDPHLHVPGYGRVERLLQKVDFSQITCLNNVYSD